MMKGLDLCKCYYEEIGRPAFEKSCPKVLERAAIGLAGEGSDCLGYDDEISRDHDWGPGFCIWLSEEDFREFGQKAIEVYDSLPLNYRGFKRLRQSEMTMGRVGVMTIEDFYLKFIGIGRCPETMTEWRMMPETGLCAATDGAVWQDPLGKFTEIRTKLLGFYPEDLRKKKLAMHASLAAQSGQYNYYRIAQRNEKTAEYQAIAEFVSNIQALVFLLNLKYKPYYKWTAKAMRELSLLGKEISPLIDNLCRGFGSASDNIEKISALVIEEFRNQHLSSVESDFLLHHAEEIQASIEDPVLRSVHLMAQ